MIRIAALSLVAVLAAACGGGAPVAAPPTDAATSIAAESQTARAETSPGATASAAPSRAPATSEPKPGQTRGARPSGVEAADPAQPGTYRYTTSGTTRIADGPERPLPEETTLEVAPASSQRQRLVRDLRDADGSGAVTEQVLEYARDGVRLVSFRLDTNFAGVARSYRFTLPSRPVLLRPGAKPGDETTFEMSGDGLTIRTEVSVLRAEQVTIAGDARDTLVVRLASTISGEIEGTQVATNNVDTGASLTVREQVESDVRQGAVRIRTAYTATLRSLRPA